MEGFQLRIAPVPIPTGDIRAQFHGRLPGQFRPCISCLTCDRPCAQAPTIELAVLECRLDVPLPTVPGSEQSHTERLPPFRARALSIFRFVVSAHHVVGIQAECTSVGRFASRVHAPEQLLIVRRVVEDSSSVASRLDRQRIDRPFAVLRRHSEAIERSSDIRPITNTDQSRRAELDFLPACARAKIPVRG